MKNKAERKYISMNTAMRKLNKKKKKMHMLTIVHICKPDTILHVNNN